MSLHEFAIKIATHLLSETPLDTDFKSGVFLWGDSDAVACTLMDHIAPLMRAVGMRVEYLRVSEFTGIPVLEQVKAQFWASSGFQDEGESPTNLSDIVQRVIGNGSSLVILIDQVDELSVLPEGVRVLKALKACRDAANLRPSVHGTVLVVGGGSNLERMTAVVCDPSQAFYGATLLHIPS